MPERQFPLIINNDPNEMMILLDNKKEFIKLLDNILIPEIYGYMQILYDSSKLLVNSKTNYLVLLNGEIRILGNFIKIIKFNIVNGLIT